MRKTIKGLKVEFRKDARVKVSTHYIENRVRKKVVELVI